MNLITSITKLKGLPYTMILTKLFKFLEVDLDDETFEKIEKIKISLKSFVSKIKSKSKINEVEEEEMKKKKIGIEKTEPAVKKKWSLLRRRNQKKKGEKKVAAPASSTTISDAKLKKITKGKEIVEDKGNDEADSDSKTRVDLDRLFEEIKKRACQGFKIRESLRKKKLRLRRKDLLLLKN